MDPAGVLQTFETERTGLGHAPVIETSCAPGRLDAASRLGDAASGLSRDDQHAHGRRRQIDSAAGGNLGEAKSVSRRARHDRRLVLDHELEALERGHGAARQAQMAEGIGGVKGRPESKERAERKREEKPVPFGDARRVINHPPQPHDPLPAPGGVEPFQGTPLGARSLVQPDVLADGLGQNAAVGRVFLLVGDQLLLGRHGETLQIAGRPDVLLVEVRRLESAPIEPLDSHHLGQHGLEFGRLDIHDLAARGRSDSIRTQAGKPPGKPRCWLLPNHRAHLPPLIVALEAP